MTQDIASLTAFAAKLLTLEAKVQHSLHKGLGEVAKRIEKTAKGELGEYQDAIGPFPAWAELADATKADRVRKGYTENDPLLRSGELRDSISHEVRGLEAEIGSTSDVAVYMELGTSKAPPRPFLGPAVEHNHAAIHRILGGAAVHGLLGGGVLPPELGYDREVT